MNTTLAQARTALLKLQSSVPAQSTYADHLRVLADYFDNQVPLNIENNNLVQRVAVAEGFVARVRALMDAQQAQDTNYQSTTGSGIRCKVEMLPPVVVGTDCTAYLATTAKCNCVSCRVRANA